MRERLIRADDTTGTLTARLAALGGDAIGAAIDGLRDGPLHATPQPAASVTFAPRIERTHARRVWTRPAVELERLVRAMQPAPAAFTTLGGKTVKVHRAALAPTGADPAPPGTVIAATPGGIDVATGDGAYGCSTCSSRAAARCGGVPRRPPPAAGNMPRRVTPGLDARAVAHDVLVRVETEAAFADRLLGARLDTLRRADRALASELVYGALAWQGRLDHHLGRLVRGPLDALDPPVRAALRLGLYQLVFLDRVPAYAAVDASVRLAHRCGRGAAGLVNAVLRRAAREGRERVALLDATADPLDRLAVEWSHPRWLVARLADEVGVDELPALLAAHNTRGPVTVRVNPLRTTLEALARELDESGVRTAPARWADGALALARGGRAARFGVPGRSLRVPGEASQLVTALLGVSPGDSVLDACAAPGGKTAQAAAASGGCIVALDVHRGGVRRIAAETARLGIANARALVADARRVPLRATFDAVLVDAPCSGLGTLRRHPELRWRRREDDLPRLATLQGELLAGVAPLVRPGGTLVYAVCTPMRTETDDVIASFLAQHPRFARESAAAHLPRAPRRWCRPTARARGRTATTSTPSSRCDSARADPVWRSRGASASEGPRCRSSPHRSSPPISAASPTRWRRPPPRAPTGSTST